LPLQLRAGLAGADWNEPASVTALFMAAQKYITSSVTKLASLIWPQKAHTGAWWEEEDGQEYIQQQHFSIKHISKYFRCQRRTLSGGVGS